VAGEPALQQFDGDRRIWVKGNPNLSQMKTIMIGIRNPKKDGAEANPWKATMRRTNAWRCG
jgi:hypothetical protein